MPPPSTCAARTCPITVMTAASKTILRRYELTDPVLWQIAHMVHEADLADDKFDSPEAPGLDVICRGLSLVAGDDEVLTLTRTLFDGLYEHQRHALLHGNNRL